MRKFALCLILAATAVVATGIPPSVGVVTHCPQCGPSGLPPFDRPFDVTPAGGDFVVDLLDFATFATHYGSCVGNPNYWHCVDYDNDGCVSLMDFAAFATHYLHQGPFPSICS